MNKGSPDHETEGQGISNHRTDWKRCQDRGTDKWGGGGGGGMIIELLERGSESQN